MASQSAQTSRPMPPRPRREMRINPWLIRLPVLFVTGTILLVIVLALFLLAYTMRFSDKVVPGVTAMGVNLTGLTQAQAEQALAREFQYDESTVFTLRDGEQFWQLSAGELGVEFNADETAAAAFAIGHDGALASDWATQAQSWRDGVTVSPIITYDENVALAKLNEIAATINQPMVEPDVSINGLQIQVVDGQAGRMLNVSQTLNELSQRISRLENGGEIPLVIEEIQPPNLSIADSAAQIQMALSSPLTLTATDQLGNQLGPWTISVDQITQLLRVTQVTNTDGTEEYQVDIEMSAFEGVLMQLAPGLITPAVDGRFEFDDASGQLRVIEGSSSGRELNVTETLRRLEQSVFSENRIVPMAFDYTLPRYHNQVTAAELGIRELVAESTTYFDGSTTNRRTNIAVGVSKLNGVIIAPGEEFSFNYYLGEIEQENGFVEGQVIFGGRTVNGLGGGICQVSTTVFRAAFGGGFAITERNSHGYRVGYYELGGAPPGLDAAIWQPERDFKFQNNTPYHLLIEATVFPSDNSLQFRFYSTKHWRAELDDAIVKNLEPAPEPRYEANRDLVAGQILQVDYAAEGADVTVYRTVYDMSGNVVVEDYAYTHYVPWQAIYQVAPGDQRLG